MGAIENEFDVELRATLEIVRCLRRHGQIPRINAIIALPTVERQGRIRRDARWRQRHQLRHDIEREDIIIGLLADEQTYAMLA